MFTVWNFPRDGWGTTRVVKKICMMYDSLLHALIAIVQVQLVANSCTEQVQLVANSCTEQFRPQQQQNILVASQLASAWMKRRLSVTNLSLENNLLTFWLNAPVIIRVKVKRCKQTLLFTVMHYWGYTSLEVKGRWQLLLPPCLLITVVQQPRTSSPPSQLKCSVSSGSLPTFIAMLYTSLACRAWL